MRKVLHFSLLEQYNGVHFFYILHLMRRQDSCFSGKVSLNAFLKQVLANVCINLEFQTKSFIRIQSKSCTILKYTIFLESGMNILFFL